jgi:hypothetical protein
MTLRALFLAGLLLAPVHAVGQGAPGSPAVERGEPSLLAAPLPGAEPVVDGQLDEAAWGTAPAASAFVQQAPQPGAAASERTEARVLYGRDALFVGVRLHDRAPDSIAAQLGRRDAADLYSDWVRVYVDSYHDRRTAFEFAVNPRGVKRDVLHFDDVREDPNWDAVWDVATRVDSAGWTAELRIPLSQLRFDAPRGPAAEQVWGVNFAREIARRNELSFWAHVPPGSGKLVSLFGALRGLRGLEPPRRLEVVPYTMARVTRAPGERSDPLHHPNDLVGSAGADVRYGLTPTLTLTATLNPDFGQVEADPALVNLTAFEVSLPEKRPFFVEGTDVFRFGAAPGSGDAQQLFYSRRIGRRPHRTVLVPGGYVDAPENTRILAAAKLSGRLGGGWSLGVFDAVTAAERARVVDPAGVPGTEPVEPLTNYAVARVSRDFRSGAGSLGAIFTATQRRLGDERLRFLRSGAYVGGVDGRWRLPGGVHEVRAWALGSHLHGSEQAIALAQISPVNSFARPDAPHLDFDPRRTSLRGWAASTSLHRIAGGSWRWSLLAAARSPGFEVNDLGFQPLADVAFGVGSLRYGRYRPGPLFRRWSLGSNAVSTWTFGGERIQAQAGVSGDFQLHSLWEGSASVSRDLAVLSTFELRGGPAVAKPARNSFSLFLQTDRRTRASLGFLVSGWAEEETRARTLNLSPTLVARPSPRMDVSLQPSLSLGWDTWQYVRTERAGGEPLYLFSRLDQTTASLVGRLNYTFSPALSLQLYAQPFVSGGTFEGFARAALPRARSFARRFQPLRMGRELRPQPGTGRYGVDLDGDGTDELSFPDPDFSSRQFRSNAVLRWEYRPGSALFVAWSQGRSGVVPDGSFELGRDVGRLLDLEPTNVLLVKVSYWLSR